MPKYNLVRNGYLSSSGTISLSYSQLERLKNGNTTSDGVDITSSGVLYLDVDLGTRIKVDDIRLYADDISKSSNITFSYRNEVGEDFIDLITSSGTGYYYTSILPPSAPKDVKITLVDVNNITLYEFVVYNDNYIVSFGEDGTEYAKYIADTPVGEVGEPEVIKIYNNSDLPMPADAYVCVDYTGNEADDYIELSSSENGPFYSLEDGILLEDNNIISNYYWDLGTFTGGATISTDKITVPLNTPAQQITVPLVDTSSSFNVAENCWDYDSINDKVYAIGSDGILKLWEFKYEDGEFEYIGEVDPGVTGHATRASMCYYDNKIYVLPNSNTRFGYYDLSGPANNWTLLTPYTHAADGLEYKRNIISDRKGAIYLIHYDRSGGTNRFGRYNTVSGTWTDLSNGYDMYRYGSTYTSFFNLSYDDDKDYVYAIAGISRYAPNLYIQRYNVSNDTWNTTYLYIGHIITEANHNYARVMTYYNNKIYFATSFQPNKIYVYNIDTALWSELSPVPDFTFRQSGVAQQSNHALTFESDNKLWYFASELEEDRTMVKWVGDLTIPSYYTEGAYTTPILKLANKNDASYIKLENDGIISTDGIAIDTIEIRSTDVDPVIINRLYIPETAGANNIRVFEWIPYTSSLNRVIDYYVGSTRGLTRSVCVDRRTGWVTGNGAAGAGYSEGSALVSFDSFKDGHSFEYLRSFGASYTYVPHYPMQNDKNGGVWGFVYADNAHTNYRHQLRHYDVYLNDICVVQLDSNELHDLATELDGYGVWYTNSVSNELTHLASNGSILNMDYLIQPRGICSTLDGGCWVSDAGDNKFYRYDWHGTLIDTVYFNTYSYAERMSHDYNNGFWYRCGERIFHVREDGVRDVGPIEVQFANRIFGCHNGCFVAEHTTHKLYFIGLSEKIITNQTTMSTDCVSYGDALSHKYEDAINFNTKFIPEDYDPVWSNLEFKAIPKDGYFLPKVRYHQLRITLRSGELRKVILAPVVRLQDISSKSSKDLFIRTNIPTGATIEDYETSIRAWWDIVDD